jgi:AbiTii
MKLLAEIIDAAVDDEVPLSTLLRKCMVLAHQLKNHRFRVWIEKELDRYGPDDELPNYRMVRAPARGTFLGIGGRVMQNQPLPSMVLKEEHRPIATEARLSQPISATHLFELTRAIEEDKNITGKPAFGEKTKQWLKELPAKTGKRGLKFGLDVAQSVATKYLLHYFGIW